ncbi:putative cell surface protein Mas1 [Tothia fuscella]|uniref:Cell surface protein Mas1 n=1 Tax=Tothia fuscella TaxID=1048955 RepID=A0A9P4NWX5_9PEZI|nr:putative cell surface protein Mas1 [Tothia fuscella]
MKYSYVFAVLAASVSAHGVITEIQGANKVVMPGLSAIDGTPRDCASPGCGSEDDTSIIRAREMGTDRASALGRTKAGGPVDAAAAISTFMGGAAAPAAATKRQLGKAAKGAKGQKTAKGATEQGVSKAAGQGASAGLPTCSDSGEITMTFHQVNQDGAGPLTAQIDPTSAGTDPAAFQDAQVTQNVPGIGIGGLSAAQTTDFPVKVQMPAGMTCSGSAGGANNVCVVRLQNAALAGPFGGSAAFTMSAGAKKRAVEYNLRKRHMARGLLGKN